MEAERVKQMEADRAELLRLLKPVALAVSSLGFDKAVSDKSVVQLRDLNDPLQTWQCGGFTAAHLRELAKAYWRVKGHGPDKEASE